MKILLQVLFAFAVTVNASTASGTCPDAAVMMEKIFAIENSDVPVPHKISQLSALLIEYETCQRKDSAYARILHRLGGFYYKNGDFEKGSSLTQQAIVVNQGTAPGVSRSFVANSFYNLGVFNAELSYFEKSNDYFDSCIAVGSNFPQKTSLVLMAIEQQCFNYYSIGEYQKSIDAADKGILIAKEKNENSYPGILLQQKAQAQLLLGDKNKAAENVQRAINLLRSSDVPRDYLASAYSIYARISLALKDPVKAIRFYNLSIDINRELQSWHQCTRDYLDLGYLYDYTLNDSAKAFQCYRKGLDVLERSPDPYLHAALYNNIGVVYWRNKNFKTALRFYQRGLNALPVSFKDTAISANPTNQMIKFVTNDYFVSTLFENKGASLLASYKNSGNKEFLLHALKAFRSADKVIDQMRWRQVHENSKLFWRAKTRKMYLDAIETCYLLNDTESAFFFFEKSRAVLLNDKLNELGANKILSSEIAHEERAHRSELYSIQNAMLSDSSQALKERWFAAQEKLERYVRELEHKYPDYFQYKYDTTRYSLNDIQKVMKEENQTLVEYFTTDSIIYSITLGPEETALRKTTFPGLDKAIHDYVQLCSTPSAMNSGYDRFAKASNELYNNFFKDLPVKTKRVVVSFDDYFIPFESFLTGEDRTSFLLRDKIFLYVYSAAYVLRNVDAKPVSNTIFGIAPVLYNSSLNLSPLRGAESSLRKIESYFSSSFSLMKDEATKQSFIKNFPEYSIVHVYSHAIADYEKEEPRLFFHDEAVRLKDLQMLPEVKTQLLVLSGCRTGVGKSIKGEGVLSLARGFASAGIPSTITTLWSVDDKVTYNIMERFYEHLHNGVPSDEALQRAKIDFLDENDGENELPYYWASTVALGKSTVIDRSASRRGIIMLYASVIILSLAAFVVYKKTRQSK